MKKFSNWFKNLSTAGRASFLIAVVLGSFVIVGATSSPPTPTSTPVDESEVKAAEVEQEPIITTETEVETAVIPFEKSVVEDSSLVNGYSYVQTDGVDGIKTITHTITFSDGVEIDRETKEEITQPPVTEVTVLGTYVAPTPSCTNGSYVNSVGNTVCRPSSDPAGATARCADGTYSYSQSRRGTCSHHGGVAAWL